MDGNFYSAFERKAKPFGSCDIPPRPSAEEVAQRRLRDAAARAQQPGHPPVERLDVRGLRCSGLLRSNCPNAECDAGEIHHADFSSSSCGVCRGQAELWWCGNTLCESDATPLDHFLDHDYDAEL